MQPLPELERLRLRCNAGFHTTPPVECGRTRGGEREFPHWREQGAVRGSREPGAGSSTQPCDWSGVLYTVGLVDAPRLMPIRPRLTRPPRILIASDQNHALSDVVRSLGRRGYSVLRVFAQPSVLERARTARPDVIVLDAALGEEQALDLSRLLRADPSIGSGTPILLLVPTRPRREDHLTALRAGVWELVRQPLDVAGLLDKLDRYVLVKVERDGVSRRDLVDDRSEEHTSE